MKERKPLRMVSKDSWLGGVCGGIAYAFGWPVWAVRLIFFIFSFAVLPGGIPWVHYAGGTLFIFYIIFWIFGPDWDEDPPDYEIRTN